MSPKTKDLCPFALVVSAVSFYLVLAAPKAMQAQTDHNQQVAESRCILNGDFDDSAEYCRAVAKHMEQ